MELTREYILKQITNESLNFYPTQNKISIPVLNRIYKKMMKNILFDAIRIDDRLIIDGHHRYLASIFAGYNLDHVSSVKTSATLKMKWSDIEFVQEEWDTPEKIDMLNKQDALYNNLTLEEIIEILN